MTVQTNTNVASFNGNGVTQIFPIAFKFNNDTDLVVLLVDDDTGSASLLTLNSDYTVSGEGNEEGGLINVVVAPATGKRLKVTRVVDILQLTDLRNQGKFFAEIHEDALDLLTMIAQQHESGINSSLRVAESDPEPARIPAVAQRAGKILSFDANGNPQVVAPVTDSSTELRLELASRATGSDGAGLVGYRGQTVRTALSRQITPEDHGAVGDGVTDDRVAIVAAMQEAAASGALFVARGNYAVAGSAEVTMLDRLTVDLRGGRFKQLNTFSKTLAFVNSSNVHITGGEFAGLGAAGGEFNGASTSYNGVAAIHFEGCADVSVKFAVVVDHAGGGIIAHNTTRFSAHKNKVTGIGPAGISSGQNGSDFGIACWSDDATVYADTGLVADISHNNVSGHAFGLFGNRFKSFIAQGNYIHDIPGQHGIYLIESSGVSITGNVFHACALHATKMNLENYVENALAPAGVINLFGFVWSDNIATSCGDGLNINSTTLSDNTDQLLFGLKVSGNVIRNCSQDGIIIMRSVGEVCDNHIAVTDRYGIQVRNSKLKLAGNNVASAGACGLLASWYHDSEVRHNTFRDCGLNSLVGATGQWPVYMVTTTLGLPSQPATARVDFEGNSIQFTTGDAVAANIALTESRYVMSVVGTRTNSLRTFRVDGKLEYGINNEFSGFSAGAISNPTGFLRGQMARDFYGQQNPSAAGSTDSFARGDRCWNSAPIAGGPMGWVCITAGAPGTWKAMALLAT